MNTKTTRILKLISGSLPSQNFEEKIRKLDPAIDRCSKCFQEIFDARTSVAVDKAKLSYLHWFTGMGLAYMATAVCKDEWKPPKMGIRLAVSDLDSDDLAVIGKSLC